MLLYNAEIITPEKRFRGYVEVAGKYISKVVEGDVAESLLQSLPEKEKINLEGKWLMAGVIDDQVHFREPGLTRKGDIRSESRAAAAGGVTSFMDMPNTMPQTTTLEAWNEKMELAAKNSLINYSFFFGATNDNLQEIEKLDASKVPGLKVFLGCSTGNMLVNSDEALDRIFSLPWLIAVHSEDEDVIGRNKERIQEECSDGKVPMRLHSEIRNNEACITSTRKAIGRAKKFGTRLHVLHVSTSEELEMIACAPDNITSEVCVHHLLFTTDDYSKLGWRIKWNPAVKSPADRERLLKGLNDDSITIIATDHAPHLESEKQGDALHAASGGPSVQYSLLIMLSLAEKGYLDAQRVTDLMSHRPAKLYQVHKRGELREGYYADIVAIDPQKPTHVEKKDILSKCGWSPYEGLTFPHSIHLTMVNGTIVYQNSEIIEAKAAESLLYENK